jgi:Family of unknown function (DUF5995)
MTNADSSSFTPARSIDEVIARLDATIERAIVERDRLGFFAVLYRTVTVAVKEGIAAGRFEDGPRMERLDIVFANRYLHAFDQHRRGQSPTRSWRAAFKAGSSRRVVILQHLLLGMNAHINLDLGIAAAEVCPGSALVGLEHDFNEINKVLATLETDVEREVCTLSPWIDRLDHIDPRAGRVVANFSIDKARTASWRTAQRLAALTGTAREAAIEEIDDDVALLAHLVERPVGFVISLNLVLVRLRETWDARKVIEVLNGKRGTAARPAP